VVSRSNSFLVTQTVNGQLCSSISGCVGSAHRVIAQAARWCAALLRFLANSVITAIPRNVSTGNAVAVTVSLPGILPQLEEKVLAITITITIDVVVAKLVNIQIRSKQIIFS